MEKEILDDDLALKPKSGIQPTLANWISIMILWGGIGYSVVNGVIIDVRLIAGVILLVIATVMTYLKYEVGVKITFGILALGVFRLVKFFLVSYSFGFGIGDYALYFEALMLLIGVIHYFTNRKYLSRYIAGLLNVEKDQHSSD